MLLLCLDGRIELRALEKIPEGVELTVSYVDFLNLSKDRQKLLKKQYYFDCKCEHCSNGIKDDLMMAVKETAGKKVRSLVTYCLYCHIGKNQFRNSVMY